MKITVLVLSALFVIALFAGCRTTPQKTGDQSSNGQGFGEQDSEEPISGDQSSREQASQEQGSQSYAVSLEPFTEPWGLSIDQVKDYHMKITGRKTEPVVSKEEVLLYQDAYSASNPLGEGTIFVSEYTAYKFMDHEYVMVDIMYLYQDRDTARAVFQNEIDRISRNLGTPEALVDDQDQKSLLWRDKMIILILTANEVWLQSYDPSKITGDNYEYYSRLHLLEIAVLETLEYMDN